MLWKEYLLPCFLVNAFGILMTKHLHKEIRFLWIFISTHAMERVSPTKFSRQCVWHIDNQAIA